MEIWFDLEIIFEEPWERYLFRFAAIRRIKETSAFDIGAGEELC